VILMFSIVNMDLLFTFITIIILYYHHIIIIKQAHGQDRQVNELF